MKYLRIYFGIIALLLSLLLISAPFSYDLPGLISFPLWIWVVVAPFVLYIIYLKKKINPTIDELPSLTVKDEQRPNKITYVCVFLGIINLIPTVSFFVGVPLTLFCSVTFLVFLVKGKRKSAIISFVGLALAVIGLYLLFSLMDHP